MAADTAVPGTTDLLAALKAATGPSAALDAAIAENLGITERRFTSSFDAALSLVPDDHDWIVASVNGHYGGTPYACVGSREEHFGETAVLSLCIAAVRARQANSAAADEGVFS